MLPIQTILWLRRWSRRALLVVVGLAVVLGPRIVWHLKSGEARSVLIVDKTVPFRSYREHSVFTWLLRNLKLSRGDGDFLSEQDYRGYDPVHRVGRDLEKRDFFDIDTVFIADTYGVYVLDYEKPGDVAALERSEKIYGGITSEESLLLEEFLHRGGTLIGEFNTFASPTEEAPREKLEHLFGAKWTHWVGRYWTDMKDASEVPKWVGRAYQRRYGKPMDVDGPAFVFVRDDIDIILLQPGIHVTPDVLSVVRTQGAPDLTGLPSEAHPLYWLDVLEQRDSEVVYEYSFSLLDAGKALMTEHAIPSHFPAMLRKRFKDSGGVAYYFAGDFIDTKSDLGDPERSGLLLWRKWTRGMSLDAVDAPLWGFYLPVLERLLHDSAAGPLVRKSVVTKK